MKPISEYNFREIVGHFVIMNSQTIPFQNSNTGKVIAYCYIDPTAGISFNLYGDFEDNNIIPYKHEDSLMILRYFEKIELDVYKGICTDDMMNYAKTIDEAYTPEWGNILNEESLDKYRDKVYPYDMLMLVASLVDNNLKLESLWVHPTYYDEGKTSIMCRTIEEGAYIKEGTDVAIMSNKVLGGNELMDLPDMIGVTPELITYIFRKINKGEINEK